MNGIIGQALDYAATGWPVFPARPDKGIPCTDPVACKRECKTPLTLHGFKDATTDPAKIQAWWRRWPDANVAIATGAPGPDVLDVDNRPAGNGFAAFNRAKSAGLLRHGAAALVRTPSGGFHVYYRGTGQACGKLPAHFIDFKSRGGYVLAPPSRVHGKPYELLDHRAGTGLLDWQAICCLLDPPKPRPAARQIPSGDAPKRWAGVLARLYGLKDGEERWRQLHWAACRAAELIAAGKLTEAEAREALMDASRANGYIADHGEREAIRKIDRGLAAEAVNR